VGVEITSCTPAARALPAPAGTLPQDWQLSLAPRREDALRYLREQAGSRFDPRVVEVFLREVAGS